jgi:broad specificity phosphatase PhoE
MILLVRHGESAQNAAGSPREHAGWGLTEHGVEQARACGRWLRATLPCAPALHSSPYERTLRTAEAFDLGPVTRRAELADRDWGQWFEGPHDPRERTELARRLAAEDPWGWRPEGGESLLDVRARVGAYLERHDHGRPVVAVSHGEPIHAMRTLLEGVPSRGSLERREGRAVHRLPNCGLLVYARMDPRCAGTGGSRYRWRGHLADPGAADPGWGALHWVDLED